MPPPAPRPIYFLSLPLPSLRTTPPLPENINPHPSLHHITLALFLSGSSLQDIRSILHSPARTPYFRSPSPLRLGPIGTFSRKGKVGVVYAEAAARRPLAVAGEGPTIAAAIADGGKDSTEKSGGDTTKDDGTTTTDTAEAKEEEDLPRAQGRLALIRWARTLREIFISALTEGSVLTRDDGGEDILHATLWKAGGGRDKRNNNNCPLDWKNLRIEEGSEEVVVGEVRVCRVGSGGTEGYEVLDSRRLGVGLEGR